jgi:hypothetical protein
VPEPTPAKESQHHCKPRSVGWGLLLFVVFFLWVLRPIWGIDVFFHIATGRVIATDGTPTTDVFSAAHPEAPWTPFQPGYGLLAYALEQAVGLDGLRVAHALFLSLTLVMLWRWLRRWTGHRTSSLFLMAVFLVVFDERIRLRPHYFNLFFEVWLLLPIASGQLLSSPRRLLLRVLIVAPLWTYLHAMGALWLVAVLGTVAVAGGDRAERRLGLLASLVATAGVVAVPGALTGIHRVLVLHEYGYQWVPELAPSWDWFRDGTFHAAVLGAIPWLAVLALLGTLRGALAGQATRRATWLACLGMGLAAIAMVRLGYYAVFCLALLVPAGRSWLFRAFSSQLAFGVSVVLLLHLGARVLPRWIEKRVVPWTKTYYPRYFPVEEVALLQRAGIGGKIFNELQYGGYLLYALHPRATVLTDGRVAFAADVGELYLWPKVRERQPELANEAWRRFGVDLLVWAKNRMPPNKNWELLVDGRQVQIFSRAGELAAQRRAALQRIGSPR